MPLTSPRAMFERAYKEGYAIGAINVNNMEIIQGIMEAGTEEKAPLILQVSAGARKYAGQNYIVKLIEAGLLEADLPVVLHLDHGADFDICKACVDGGFTSVMIDGSHHSFEDNIAVTKRVVEYAHAHGVWVEAELGRLAGVEEDVSSEHSIYTDPDQAVEFVERSGCDSLAIAIGTSHGAYKFKGEAKLDFERLEKIGSLMPGYPLVLHGASSVPQEFVEMCNTYGGKVAGAAGVPEELLRKAAGMAICKINIDTDIRLAMTASIREDTVRTLYHIRVEQKVEIEPAAKVTGTNKDASPQAPQKRETRKIYPNDPCPCGSGKKFKQCCGRQMLADMQERKEKEQQKKERRDERRKEHQAEKAARRAEYQERKAERLAQKAANSEENLEE